MENQVHSFAELTLFIKHLPCARCWGYINGQERNSLLTWRFYFLRDLVTNVNGVCEPFREKGNWVPIAESTFMMLGKDLICLRIVVGSS